MYQFLEEAVSLLGVFQWTHFPTVIHHIRTKQYPVITLISSESFYYHYILIPMQCWLVPNHPSIHTSETYCSPRTVYIVVINRSRGLPRPVQWPFMCGTLTCETNGRSDVSVSVGASLLDTTAILNGTVSHTYPQHVWISSSLEVCHYFLMLVFSCHIQGSSLMEAQQIQQSNTAMTKWLTSGQGDIQLNLMQSVNLHSRLH